MAPTTMPGMKSALLSDTFFIVWPMGGAGKRGLAVTMWAARTPHPTRTTKERDDAGKDQVHAQRDGGLERRPQGWKGGHQHRERSAEGVPLRIRQPLRGPAGDQSRG